MIQPEHYLPREKWSTINNGDRVQIERTDGTILEGVVKCYTSPTGFDIGPYYMAFAYIKSLKMIKAHDPNEENRIRLAKALYRARLGDVLITWDAADAAVKQKYLFAADAAIAEFKKIEAERRPVVHGAI